MLTTKIIANENMSIEEMHNAYLAATDIDLDKQIAELEGLGTFKAEEFTRFREFARKIANIAIENIPDKNFYEFITLCNDAVDVYERKGITQKDIDEANVRYSEFEKRIGFDYSDHVFKMIEEMERKDVM